VFDAAFGVALLALSLALDVFAVSIGVGVGGNVDRSGKIRIGVAFALAEVVMNLLGALLGSLVGKAVGDVAGYFGFVALIGVGIYMIVEAVRDAGEDFNLSHGWGLLLASLSISLDSLGIGFSIVYIRVPLAVTLAAIAVASIVSTTLGLRFGASFGKRVGEYAGIVAGIVLMVTGVLFLVLKYFHVA